MYKEQFHEKMKEARIRAGYTQKQITELTGIPQSAISKIEKGVAEPSIENLGILIDFYEVSADWILGTGIKRGNQ